MSKARLGLAAALVLLPAMTALAQSPAVRIYAAHTNRAAHVETIGVLHNGTEERNAGSGFLIGDRLIVTNNHLIPPEENFRSLDVNIRLATRTSNPSKVVSVARDADRDLALLTLAVPVAAPPRIACPVPFMDRSEQIPIGTSIFVLGYPVDHDLSIIDGLISNKSASEGRWQTNTLLNPGNSGGPAFSDSGVLVGFASGGARSWKPKGAAPAKNSPATDPESIRVTGVNYIIPTNRLFESPLFAALAAQDAKNRCWIAVSKRLDINLSMTADIAVDASFKKPFLPISNMSRSYNVSSVKDDHPNPMSPHSRDYSRTFTAEPGFTITACSWQSMSENNASAIACELSKDAKAATFRYRLRSGPMFDRYRGWIDTTVFLSQRVQ
jgi:S1-C subfamily serine protease